MAKTALLVNPVAARGRSRKWVTPVRKAIESSIGPCELIESQKPLDLQNSIAALLANNVEVIVSLGGDGTHSEVSRGVAQSQPSPASVAVLFLAAGTGSDFCRNLTKHKNPVDAIKAIQRDRSKPIDMGIIKTINSPGESQHFLNVASCGAGAQVDRMVPKLRPQLWGSIDYLRASLKVLPKFQPVPIRISVDDKVIDTRKAQAVTICNGRWAGGGMPFAPTASLTDGLFDVVSIDHLPIHQSLLFAPRFYSGKHIGHPYIASARGQHVRLDALEDGRSETEVDGDPWQFLPVEAKVLPGVLRVVGLND